MERLSSRPGPPLGPPTHLSNEKPSSWVFSNGREQGRTLIAISTRTYSPPSLLFQPKTFSSLLATLPNLHIKKPDDKNQLLRISARVNLSPYFCYPPPSLRVRPFCSFFLKNRCIILMIIIQPLLDLFKFFYQKTNGVACCLS